MQVFLELQGGGGGARRGGFFRWQDMWFSFRSRSDKNSPNKTSAQFEEGPRQEQPEYHCCCFLLHMIHKK